MANQTNSYYIVVYDDDGDIYALGSEDKICKYKTRQEAKLVADGINKYTLSCSHFARARSVEINMTQPFLGIALAIDTSNVELKVAYPFQTELAAESFLDGYREAFNDADNRPLSVGIIQLSDGKGE